jgi:hypothetical protein
LQVAGNSDGPGLGRPETVARCRPPTANSRPEAAGRERRLRAGQLTSTNFSPGDLAILIVVESIIVSLIGTNSEVVTPVGAAGVSGRVEKTIGKSET